jgi:hypothetical protein
MVFPSLSRLWCKQRKRGIFAGERAEQRTCIHMLSIEEFFRGRHFDREIIILCVRWYLRFKLSFRDLVEIMAEHGAYDDNAVEGVGTLTTG